MTADYCRHCHEPLAGPRESGGVCQRCGETEREANSDLVVGVLRHVRAHEEWLAETVRRCVPTALGEDALEQEFGLHGVRRLNSLTVAQCRELLARGRELQDALRPRIERLAVPVDDTAPDWDRLRADEAADGLASGADVWHRVASALPVDADADAVVAMRIAEVTGRASTRPLAARLDLSPEAVAANAEAVSASLDRAKATLEEAALKKWYAAAKRDPDNEQLVRSFERAYPAAKRLGSDGPDDGGDK